MVRATTHYPKGGREKEIVCVGLELWTRAHDYSCWIRYSNLSLPMSYHSKRPAPGRVGPKGLDHADHPLFVIPSGVQQTGITQPDRHHCIMVYQVIRDSHIPCFDEFLDMIYRILP